MTVSQVYKDRQKKGKVFKDHQFLH
jgi:hypothetical protein